MRRSRAQDQRLLREPFSLSYQDIAREARERGFGARPWLTLSVCVFLELLFSSSKSSLTGFSLGCYDFHAELPGLASHSPPSRNNNLKLGNVRHRGGIHS